MPRIGIDVDDVVAALMPEWLRSYNAEYNTSWTPEDLTCWEFGKDLGCDDEVLQKHLVPELYQTVKPCDGALYTVKAIREMGWKPVYITSSHDEPTWLAKLDWLIKYEFLADDDEALPVGMWCRHQTKRQVGQDLGIPILVDDNVEHCRDWDGTAFLLDQPHNRRELYEGRRLKRFTDLIPELKWWPKADPNGLKEVLPLKMEGILQATKDGWVSEPYIRNTYTPVSDVLKKHAANLKATNPKDALSVDKLPLHLWPLTATVEGTLAMLEGALKYGRSNFRVIGVRASVYVDAALRHLNAWIEGEDRARDSDISHLGHALACIAILVDAREAGKLVDDRNYQGGYIGMVERLTPEVKRLREKYADKEPKHYTREDSNGFVPQEAG